MKQKKVVKKFGVDFNSDGGALTLSPYHVTDKISPYNVTDTGQPYDYEKEYSFTHESGWTITGKIHEDYYGWVNDFKATHPRYGKVVGNFESKVTASSEEAFQHFWKHHEPEAWDYNNI